MARGYTLPSTLALALHGLVLAFFMVQSNEVRPLAAANKPAPVNIVQAVAIDQTTLEQEIKAIQAEHMVKQQARDAQQVAAKQALAKAKQQRKQEETRLARLKADAKKQERKAKQVASKLAALEKKQKAIKQKQQAAEQLRQAKIKQTLQATNSAKQSAKVQKEVNRYKALIVQSIGQRWIVPPDIAKDLSCMLSIRLAPGGKVISVQLVRSSGNTVLDRSAQAAVYKASPLPVPIEPDVFDKFRELSLTVRPEGLLSQQG